MLLRPGRMEAVTDSDVPLTAMGRGTRLVASPSVGWGGFGRNWRRSVPRHATGVEPGKKKHPNWKKNSGSATNPGSGELRGANRRDGSWVQSW